MAKKPASSGRNSPNIKPLKRAPTRSRSGSSGASSSASTPVRNTTVPKAQPPSREITHEQISWRAYEIYISGTGGTPEENWLRAERELRGGL